MSFEVIHSAVPILLSILLRKARGCSVLQIRVPGILVLVGEGLGRLDDKKWRPQDPVLDRLIFCPQFFVSCGSQGLRMRGSHALAGAATGDGRKRRKTLKKGSPERMFFSVSRFFRLMELDGETMLARRGSKRIILP